MPGEIHSFVSPDGSQNTFVKPFNDSPTDEQAPPQTIIDPVSETLAPEPIDVNLSPGP